MNLRNLSLVTFALAVSACSEEPPPDVGTARALLAEKGPAEARPLILFVADDPPVDLAKRVELAELLIEVQEGKRAAEILMSAGELTPEATDVLIHALLVSGQRDEAGVRIADLIAAGRDTARTRLLKGMLALARGDRRAAEDEIRESMRRDDTDPLAHAWLGFVLLQSGRTAEAESRLRNALARFPKSPEVRAGLATVIQASREPGPAVWSAVVDLLAPAVEARPSDRNSRQNLAEAYRRLGRLAEAEGEFDALISGWPQEASYWSGLGTVRMEREKFRDAADAYEQAVDLAPRSVPMLLNLGGSYLKLVKLSHDRAEMAVRARGVFERAIALDAENPLVHVGLGRATVKENPESDEKVHAAMAHYERALELDSNCHQAHLNLALLYYDVWGEGEGMRKAKHHFDRAAETGPGPDEWDRHARDAFRMVVEALRKKGGE